MSARKSANQDSRWIRLGPPEVHDDAHAHHFTVVVDGLPGDGCMYCADTNWDRWARAYGRSFGVEQKPIPSSQLPSDVDAQEVADVSAPPATRICERLRYEPLPTDSMAARREAADTRRRLRRGEQ